MDKNIVKEWLVKDGIYPDKNGFEALAEIISNYTPGGAIINVYMAYCEENGMTKSNLLKLLKSAIDTSKLNKTNPKQSVGSYVYLAQRAIHRFYTDSGSTSEYNPDCGMTKKEWLVARMLEAQKNKTTLVLSPEDTKILTE